ncbi:MAG: isopentenyl phosphate kinase family protein [Nitrososphaerales archaeon]|nr:isopentenyl phosphate kinase family protein [Nitrososphaerales archaeon]
MTDKSKPFSYRSDVASALAEEIASSDEKVVVVHGGGSFGHTVAKQYGLTSSSATGSSVGVPQTRNAMYELNHLVCKTMMEFKVSPYPFAPFDMLTRATKSATANWLKGLLKAGLTPVTFGDVSLLPGGFKVFSGDAIVQELARILKPDWCVFALDVDGVYEENTKVIIPELTPAKIRRMKVGRGEDATGGMRAKLEVAAKVAAGGTPVSFVSGYRRNEFSKALRGLDFYGTVVKP